MSSSTTVTEAEVTMARDAAIAVVERHEREKHGGHLCLGYRRTIAGYFLSGLRFTAETYLLLGPNLETEVSRWFGASTTPESPVFEDRMSDEPADAPRPDVRSDGVVDATSGSPAAGLGAGALPPPPDHSGLSPSPEGKSP